MQSGSWLASSIGQDTTASAGSLSAQPAPAEQTGAGGGQQESRRLGDRHWCQIHLDVEVVPSTGKPVRQGVATTDRTADRREVGTALPVEYVPAVVVGTNRHA